MEQHEYGRRPVVNPQLCWAGHGDTVNRAHFLLDGVQVVTASMDGTARIYTLNITEMIAMSKSRFKRELNCDERVQYLNEERDYAEEKSTKG